MSEPTLQTNYAVAPGEYLHEWCENANMTVGATAKGLGCDTGTVIAFVEGQLRVSPEFADLLAGLTSIPVSSWLALQEQYDTDRIRLGL